MKSVTWMIELVIIAVGSVTAGFIWNLLPRSQNGMAMGLLTFLGVTVIHFFYDDRPKGDLEQDIPILIMSFVYEAIFMAGSLILCTIALIPLAIVTKLFGWPLPEFADLTLAVWFLVNLYFGWTQIVMKTPKPDASDYSNQAL